MTSSKAGGHWATLQETSVSWGITTLVWIYRVFGRWVFRLFLRPVVIYYFLRGGIARNASQEYLRRLGQYFPELGITGGWRNSYRHFLNFGETLLDKIIVWTGGIGHEQADFPNRGLLLDLVGQKRGAMLISGHIGNLEFCQAIARQFGRVRLNILVHTRHAEKFNRLLVGSDEGANVHLIQVTELNPAIAIELQEKIEQGEFVVLVGDRIPINGGRTVRAKFLGRDADFPQGPYLLASLLHCPVYTLFCYRVGERFRVDLEPFADAVSIPRASDQRRQMLESLARRYAVKLEALCREQPLQWFNFYPYWPPLEESACVEADLPGGRT